MFAATVMFLNEFWNWLGLYPIIIRTACVRFGGKFLSEEDDELEEEYDDDDFDEGWEEDFDDDNE